MRKIKTRAHSNVLIDVSDLVQIDFRICAVKQLQFLMFVYIRAQCRLRLQTCVEDDCGSHRQTGQ